MPRLAHGPRTIGVVLACLVALVISPQLASASSAPITSATVSIDVVGQTVQAVTTIRVASPTKVSAAGLCVRDGAGNVRDLPMTQSPTLTVSGTSLKSSRTLGTGKYTYWACVKPVGARWQFVAPARSFTVSDSTSSMPVGNLPGWTQIFADNFSASTGQGTFPGPYKAKWTAYHGFYDTAGHGLYDRNIISAHDGLLDTYLRTVNGVARVAAPVPLINGSWAGQTYGRYTARFKSDAVNGYRVAWLLWPDSGDWNTGEIDFPESWLDGKIDAFNHCPNSPTKNCYWAKSDVSPNAWHTVTINWTPKLLSFVIDGKVMGSTTAHIPSAKMHWVMQSETVGSKTLTGSGHLYIDWVSIYKYTP